MASGEAILHLLDEVNAWKATIRNFDSSYNEIRDKIDKVYLSTKAFADSASLIAAAGSSLSEEMADLLDVISETSSPSERTKKRTEDRLLKLQQKCETMGNRCQSCINDLNNISSLMEELTASITDKEMENRKQIKTSTTWKAWIRKIVKCVISAAEAFNDILAGDHTDVLEIGARVVTATVTMAKNIYVEVKDARALHQKEVARLRYETTTLENISASVSMGEESLVTMKDWWASAQNEIGQLERSSTSGLTWGPNVKTSNDIAYWTALGQRFADCGGAFDEDRDRTSILNAPLRRASTTSTALENRFGSLSLTN